MDFQQLNARIGGADEGAGARARARLNGIAKPVGSLGALEEDIVRIAALTGSERISLKPRTVLVMCADNGVASPEVAITPVRITRVVAEMMADGKSNLCHMAALAGARVLPFDVGMRTRSENPGLIDFHIADGTMNIAEGPAMTREQALALIAFGIEQARLCALAGDKLLATGEMGVANTTTAAALAAVLLGLPVCEVTGRGSGLSDDKLSRKIAIIERAIDVNRPDPEDALDALIKLGGFDIAALCGAFLGGALCGVPVLLDGLISSVAALVAARLCPNAKKAMLASHISAEPAGGKLLEALGLLPLICAGLRLGEGTGAVAAMPLLDMALAIYDDMLTFKEIGMDA